MKFIVTLIALLCCAVSQAAIVAVSPETTITNGTTGTVTLSNVTAGNTLVVMAHNDLNATTQFSVTDTQADTYQSAVVAGDANVAGLTQILYAKNVRGGSTTVTVTAGSSISFTFRIAESTQPNLAATDHNTVSSTTHNESASGISPNQAVDVFCVATGINTLVSPTAGSGYTSPGSGSPYDFYEYQSFSASPTNEQGLWTTTNGLRTVGVIAAFGQMSGGGGGPNSITVTWPPQFYTAQRSGNIGSIHITGTYGGTPTAFEANLSNGAYQTITSTFSNGVYSGDLVGQTQGQGQLNVRFANDHSTVATVANVGIGEAFLVIGQSNATSPLTQAQTFTHPTLSATAFDGANSSWKIGNDPLTLLGPGSGSYWPLFMSLIMADQGVPAAVVTSAVGATGLTNYATADWTKGGINGSGGAEYAGMQSIVTASGVNGIRCVLDYQGEKDVGAFCPLNVYAGRKIDLFENLHADLPGSPATIATVLGFNGTTGTADGLTAIDEIRQGTVLATVTSAPSGRAFGPICVYDLSNATHPTSGNSPDNPIGTTVAARYWAVLKSRYYGGNFPDHGPRIVNALHNAARTTVQVRFDQPLKTGLTHDTTLWTLTGNGTAATVQSIGYVADPNSLSLTLGAATVEPIVVSYATGSTTAGKVAPLGQDIPLPTMPAPWMATINHPAEPFAFVTATLDPDLN